MGGDGDRGFYPGIPSPTSIRNGTRFPVEIMYIMMMFKISCLSILIYDILNMHWQSSLGSAAVRESCTLAEPPIKDFTDAEDILPKMLLKYNVFIIIFTDSPIFCVTDSRYSTILDGKKHSSRNFCKPTSILYDKLVHTMLVQNACQ